MENIQGFFTKNMDTTSTPAPPLQDTLHQFLLIMNDWQMDKVS